MMHIMVDHSSRIIIFFIAILLLVHSSRTTLALVPPTLHPLCKDRCSVHQKHNSFHHVNVQCFATNNANNHDSLTESPSSSLDSRDDVYPNENDDRIEIIFSTPNKNDNTSLLKRKKFLTGIPTATAFLYAQSSAKKANAIDNPFNLKGTFWETGQLYEKSNTSLPDNETDFISILQNTIDAFHSSKLLDTISEGNYSQTLRLLRGGLISESKIRLSAYALIDLLPEDNDDEIVYKCNESFRIFLRYFDTLDKEVELASRPSFPLGGGVGEGDVRIELLTRVGEVEDALKIFVNNVKVGLGE